MLGDGLASDWMAQATRESHLLSRDLFSSPLRGTVVFSCVFHIEKLT